MKVLHVIDTLNVGGAEKVFVTITTVLRQHGIIADAMLFNNSGALIADLHPEVQLHLLDRKSKYDIQKLKETHSVCSAYDIVHAHLRHCYAYIRVAQLLFRGKYKLILHDHSSDMPVDKIPLRLKGILKPQYYIGVNNVLVNWAKQHLRVERTYTLHNTILTSINASYRYPSKCNRTILVSNIREVKQLPFAIQVCNQSDLELTIYGNRQEPSYFHHIQKLASDNGARIEEGVTDFSDIYGHYALALHTSASETGPLVLLEYLSQGISFLAYKTGAVADTIAAELPLHFIDNFQIDKWVDRIHAIREKGDITQNLKATFHKHYSSDCYAKQCLFIYRSVLC